MSFSCSAQSRSPASQGDATHRPQGSAQLSRPPAWPPAGAAGSRPGGFLAEAATPHGTQPDGAGVGVVFVGAVLVASFPESIGEPGQLNATS